MGTFLCSTGFPTARGRRTFAKSCSLWTTARTTWGSSSSSAALSETGRARKETVIKLVYAGCLVLGAVLPYWQLVPWLAENGFDPASLVKAMFATRVASFAWLDVLVSAVVLLVFIAVEGRRLAMSFLWLPMAGTLCIGVSFGLPLFLLMRQLHIERMQAQA